MDSASSRLGRCCAGTRSGDCRVFAVLRGRGRTGSGWFIRGRVGARCIMVLPWDFRYGLVLC